MCLAMSTLPVTTNNSLDPFLSAIRTLSLVVMRLRVVKKMTTSMATMFMSLFDIVSLAFLVTILSSRTTRRSRCFSKCHISCFCCVTVAMYPDYASHTAIRLLLSIQKHVDQPLRHRSKLLLRFQSFFGVIGLG